MLASASPLNPHRLYRLQVPKRRQFRRRVPLSPSLLDFALILIQNDHPKLLNTLFHSKLQPHHLHPILLSLQSNPITALRFLDRARGSLGLHHHPQSFCTLIHLLLRHRMLAPVSRLFKNIGRPVRDSVSLL
ncbi:hypothetical protein ACFX19_014140 [Malus domestica]